MDGDQNVHGIYQKAASLQEEQFQRKSGRESQETWVEDRLVNEEVEAAFPKQHD